MQYDVGGEHELITAMIARAVHEQQDQVPGISLGHGVEKYLEAFGVGRRQDQKDAGPILGRHRPVQINILADQLGGDLGSCAERRPARPRPVHAAKARLVGKHDAQPPAAPRRRPPGIPYNVRKAVFLKAFCAFRLRWG